MVKIACWNINSINARIESVREFITTESPDILLLQELKCIEERFPTTLIIDEFYYNAALNCQKTLNGVAILSKYPTEEIQIGFDGDPDPSQARYIEALISVDSQVIRCASVYVPNGQEVGCDKFHYKLEFLKAFKNRLKELLSYEEITIIGGDYNVAPEALDVFDPISSTDKLCFSHIERVHFRELINLGYYDTFRSLNPQAHEFTWWDYRGGAYKYNKGLRIDHILTSPRAIDLVEDISIFTKAREWVKPSDHAPIICKLRLDYGN